MYRTSEDKIKKLLNYLRPIYVCSRQGTQYVNAPVLISLKELKKERESSL